MKECKDIDYIKKKYKNYFAEEEKDLKKMCHILENYLEPFTPKVMEVLGESLTYSLRELIQTLRENNIVVRTDAYPDDSKKSHKLLFETMNKNFEEIYGDNDDDMFPRLIAYLRKAGVFVSLEKKASHELYDFISKWTSQYAYTEKIKYNIPADLIKELKGTVRKDTYTCYRGLNFSKADLIKFFENTEMRRDGTATVKLHNFSSWSTEMNIAQNFMLNNKERRTSHQIILQANVIRNDILADISGYSLSYEEKELILFPGKYEVILYIYDPQRGRFVHNPKIWDTMASID